MSVKTKDSVAEVIPEAVANQAVVALAKALKGSQAFQALLEAAREMNRDNEAQEIQRQIADHQSAIRWGRGDPQEHLRALRDLDARLRSRPSVQTYLQALESTRALFRAVDAIISERAGVDFAANAKRSCCG